MYTRAHAHRTDHDELIEKKARSLLDRMTLSEKIGQLSGDEQPFPGVLRLAVASRGRPTAAGACRRLGIPPLRFTDGPRGIVLGRSTCFPVPSLRAAGFDPGLEERIGEAVGKEARAAGADCVGAPCINLLRHPAWGRAQDTYGEDPLLTGELGAACVRGIQRYAMACVKHFALNSIEKSRFRLNVRITERALREVHLPHWRRCLEEQPAAVMTAYNKVNGDYCSQNARLLSAILKGEWGYRGLVMSDWLYGVHDTRAALLAGLDLEMPFPHYYGKRLEKPARNDRTVRDKVDDAVLRILRQKLRFAHQSSGAPRRKRPRAFPAHRELARLAAEQCAVLLKNDAVDGAPLLPLDRPRLRRIAVIGGPAAEANLGDDGSGSVFPPSVCTPLAGLKEKMPSLIVYDNGRSLTKAARLARESDVAIVVTGYTRLDEGEYLSDCFLYRRGKAGDRRSLRLRPHDENLILQTAAANPRTVVVLVSGSAVITEAWRAHVPALLWIGYPGMEGGRALANLLMGEVNPSGKLPCSFPRAEGDLPFFDREADEIEYGYFHGYRLADRTGHAPAFAFGFGLSYSGFLTGEPKLSHRQNDDERSVRVDCAVTNTGTRPGAEVVQVYAGLPDSRYERAPKILVGFRKVFLEPGETRPVSLSIPHSRLTVWDNGWVTEPGEYVFWVGNSSREEDCRTVRIALPGTRN